MKPAAIVLVGASLLVSIGTAVWVSTRPFSDDADAARIEKAACAEAEVLRVKQEAARGALEGRIRMLEETLKAQSQAIDELEQSLALLRQEAAKAAQAAPEIQAARKEDRLQDMALRTVGQITVQQVMAGKDDFLRLIRNADDLAPLAAVNAQFRMQRYLRSGKLGEAGKTALSKSLKDGDLEFLGKLQGILKEGKTPSQQQILGIAEQIWAAQDESMRQALAAEEYPSYQREAKAERAQARVFVSFAFPKEKSAEENPE